MKPSKTVKTQEVTTFVTPSTDPEKTREREARSERLAKGQGRWSTSGRRTDKGGKEE